MSKRIKVMSVFGTRPEAIKMAPLVLELQKHPELESVVCITAQHREMLDSVMDCFGIRADYDLNIMQQGQDLTAITTRVLERMREVLSEVQPDIVLVHGDTTTTFAGALAAFYAKIPVGHVEAGLRTYDRWSPFPEEMNRSLVGRIATLLGERTEGYTANQSAEAAVKAIRELSRDVNIPEGLIALGKKYGKEVREEDIPIMTANAQKDACGLTNPRTMTDAAVAAIYKKAL